MSQNNKSEVVYIPLTQGKEAVVDAFIASVVLERRWFYVKGKGKGSSTGYVYGNDYEDKARTIHLHRFIWENVHGAIPDNLTIDHINGNGLDNRVDNLRLADRRLQAYNNARMRSGLNSSKFCGVTWDKRENLWAARISIQNKKYGLGWFADELDANSAYQNALNAYNLHGTLPNTKTKSSKYKGVSWISSKKKWCAQVVIQKVSYYLGYFDDEIEASNVYQATLTAYNTSGILPQRIKRKTK